MRIEPIQVSVLVVLAVLSQLGAEQWDRLAPWEPTETDWQRGQYPLPDLLWKEAR